MSMNEETFELLHIPRMFDQVESCVDPGDGHAVHHRRTGLVNYTCNCGYTSGWVPKGELPIPYDFTLDHLPAGVNQGDLSRPTRTFDPELFDE